MSDFVGQRIHVLRIQRGLSLRKLAQMANIPQGNLSEIEGGKRQGSNLTLASAKRLAVALGVSIDYLAGMYEDAATDDEEAERLSPWRSTAVAYDNGAVPWR